MNTAGNFIMVEQTPHTASILASQVRIFISQNKQDVYNYGVTHSDQCLVLGIIDALASIKTWPDLLLHEGQLYKRDLQVAFPDGASHSEWFGFRMYVKTQVIESGRTHTLMLYHVPHGKIPVRHPLYPR